ncbi:MAG: hypothetical protein KDE14_16440 [Rhodobacteraceae bacterium]|nr:hypothetical protein [Paracoccaceae bacterium]
MPELKAERVEVPGKIKGRKTVAIDFNKSDTDQQVWLGNPHIDNLVHVVIALGAELWTSKQRQIIAEKLAEKGIPATYQAIETYKPTREEEAQWEEERRALASRLYGVFGRATTATNVASK